MAISINSLVAFGGGVELLEVFTRMKAAKTDFHEPFGMLIKIDGSQALVKMWGRSEFGSVPQAFEIQYPFKALLRASTPQHLLWKIQELEHRVYCLETGTKP